ncbi:hypothetical protein Pcinc_019300 [Petrolisthes cinctipes]|uniref:Uncharacterized protein n=1 Tax=Petrolisthes cinctipes TaxID=88211 RepID=A0AAE1FKE2_PETCI|nr:hypothetical protein Pcinc_019300 [Petrolisthes cinctipes]
MSETEYEQMDKIFTRCNTAVKWKDISLEKEDHELVNTIRVN